MAIDTLDILAATPVLTRRHTSNQAECGFLGLSRIVLVTRNSTISKFTVRLYKSPTDVYRHFHRGIPVGENAHCTF